VADAGEFRFARDGQQTLTLTGRFAGPADPPQPDAPPWDRTRIEVFLKPFPDCPAMVQFGVAADGARAVAWHGCDAPATLSWTAQARSADKDWTASLSVPLAAIEAWVRQACAVPPAQTADWRALAGATVAPRGGDFATWQEHAGDRTGVVADPLFVDPSCGDFRLDPNSPALALGFVPFACPDAT
jgi:hypothetical protein